MSKNKQHLKKNGEELQQYLQFRRRGSKIESRRKEIPRKAKHKNRQNMVSIF